MRNIDRIETQKKYGELYHKILQIFHEEDPIFIRSVLDEYSPEVCSILPRLKIGQDLKMINHIVHQEFVFWFSEKIAGPKDAYLVISEKILALYSE